MFNSQKEEKDSQGIETKEEETKQEETVEKKKTETNETAVKEKPERKKEVETEPVAKTEEPVEEKKAETNETAVKEKPEQATEVETKPEAKPEEPASEKKKDKDMMSLMDEYFSKFKAGEIVKGQVVNVDEHEIMVDIGYKSESAISIREFSAEHIPEVGSEIKVYIDSVEDGSGRLKLSKKKADFYLNINTLKEKMANNETVEGVLKRRVKGGMIAEVMGLEAFLPGSHISTKPIPNLDQFIGKKANFKILKIDEDRRNIIVSRKSVMEEERNAQLEELKDKIEVGAELDGEVRNITDYGAFIDLGGVDGLLHITDMSWGHINHPSDMLNIGDKVKVKVLDYDPESMKVSLGLKQLVPHPWENIETKYPEGSIVSGKVVNITNYGAFVELESGVEGLVHVSEMSWTRKIRHPKQILKVGDTVKAIVLSTSKEEKRISLGIKQMEPNPWLTIDERYPVGTEIEGVVKSITPFGIFVEIEENIEGLIHISDISWTKRIYNPKKFFKKGEKVKVKVLSIDKTLHRIALGVKQLTPDPWENLDEKLPINSEVTAKIAKLIPKGVLVDVKVDDNYVEGFVPLSHLGIPNLKNASLAFKEGDELPLKIIELDLENRRLILSVKAYYFTRSKEELDKYIAEREQVIKESLEQKRAQKERRIKKKEEKKAEQPPKKETVAAKNEENSEETLQTEPLTEEPENKETKEQPQAEKTEPNVSEDENLEEKEVDSLNTSTEAEKDTEKTE
jgi:small subunit ribosomal protein S1